MNNIEAYWQQFCELEGLQHIRYTEAFQFGEKADWLASLVIAGTKTATCSSFPLYELEKEPLPKVGDYQIVLNSKDEPVAIIKRQQKSFIKNAFLALSWQFLGLKLPCMPAETLYT